MEERHDDFYQKLRRRIQGWLAGKGENYRYADYLLVGPDLFHLLCRLAGDRRVPSSEKTKIAGAIAYFISPVDLIPEGLIGPLGYIDDIALAAYVLNSVINAGHGEIAKEHWAGEDNLLDVIQQVLELADKVVGSGMWARLKSMGNRMR